MLIQFQFFQYGLQVVKELIISLELNMILLKYHYSIIQNLKEN
jgi:hypothetical protein